MTVAFLVGAAQMVIRPVHRPTAPMTPPTTIRAKSPISVGVKIRRPCSLRALT